MLEELEDRYGPAPEAVKMLLRFSAVKSSAEKLGVESVDKKGAAILMKFHPESPVDPMMLMDLVQSTPGAQFAPNGVMRVPLDAVSSTTAGLIGLLEGQFGQLTAAQTAEPPPANQK